MILMREKNTKSIYIDLNGDFHYFIRLENIISVRYLYYSKYISNFKIDNLDYNLDLDYERIRFKARYFSFMFCV